MPEKYATSAADTVSVSPLIRPAIALVALALSAVLLWTLHAEFLRDREQHLESIHDAARGAAGRIAYTLDQQRLDIQRLALALTTRNDLTPREASERINHFATSFLQRVPEFLAVELLDREANPLDYTGLPIHSEYQAESRSLIESGQLGAFLSSDEEPPRYELLVPLRLAKGPGALRIAVGSSLLSSPLEWFEPPGMKLFLIRTGDPTRPLLGAQRPFDLTRGMPPGGSIVPLAETASPIAGSDWAVIAVPGTSPVGEAPGRYIAFAIAGLFLIWASAALVYERVASEERRRREHLESEQRYLQHLEREVTEQTRDLAASRARLEEAQRITLVGSYDYDIAADRISFSPAFAGLLGIDPETPLNMESWHGLLLEEERAESVAYLASRIVSGEPCDRIYRIRRANDGVVRWVHGRGEFVFDADKRPVLMRGTLQDITHLKEVEDALRDSESRANLILDTVPEGILVVAGDGRIVRANPEADRMFGYAPGALCGQEVEILIPPAKREGHRAMRAGFSSQDGRPRMMGQGRHLKALRRDGSEFHIEVGLGPVVIAGEPHVIVIVSDISARIATELDLRRFREILDTSGDLLAFVDRNFRYGVANPAYSSQFGKTPAEIHGCPLASVMPPDLFAEAEPYLCRALAGETVNYVTARRSPSGEERLYEAEFRPFLTATGVEGVVASLHDVTQRVRTEMALRESELKTRAAFNTPFINLGLLDAQGRIQLINDTALQAVGARLADLAGKLFWEGPWYDHDPQMRARMKEGVEAAIAGEACRFEITSSLANGEMRYKDFIIQPVRDATGTMVWITVQSIDITERVLARRSLEVQHEKLEAMVAERTTELVQSEEKFRSLVEQPIVSIYIICDGVFTYANPGLAHMFGYDSPEEMIGKVSITDTIAPECRDTVLSRIRERVEKRSNVAQYIFTAIRRDGSRFEVEVQGRAFDYQGRPAVIGIANDITERRQMEAARETALAEARRLASARSEFLANMSHEIRTPLNAVLGLAQVGYRDSQGRQISATFRRILDSGQTLLAVVNDILDYSKIEAGKLKLEGAPFVLGEVIDRAAGIVAPLAYAKGLAMAVEEAPGLPLRVVGDSVRVTQILLNLLSNAVKFTESGRITLSVRCESNGLHLHLSDTGIGIPSAEIGRLFQPFEQADGSTTRRFGGTGLGLSIVHSLVRMMGGEIHVTSDSGQGSHFDVCLPLRIEDSGSPRPPVRITLSGLPEGAELAAALEAHGHQVGTGVAASPRADIHLVDGDFAADRLEQGQTLEEVIGSGNRVVALAVTPGGKQLPASLRDSFPLLERPIHPRRVLALLEPGIADHAPSASANRLEGISILAAEDNEVNRMVLEDMLVHEGARLVLAENGRIALDTVLSAGANAFDLVITDIQMPVLDGYGLALRLREIAPQLPVIGLTAHAMPEERDRCLAAGMVERLTKPVDMELLIKTVTDLVGSKAANVYAHPAPGDAAPSPSAPAEGPPSSGLLNWSALETRFRGKREFVQRLLEQFDLSYGNVSADLRQIAAREDFEGLSALAHTLKGVYGNLLVPAAVDLANRTDQLARAADPAAWAEAAQLAELNERFLTEVRQRLPQPETTH